MNAIIKLFAGLSLFIGSFFAPHAIAPTLGAAAGCSSGQNFSPLQTQVFQLAGNGITNNATSVLLTSMAYSNGSLVSMCDVGTIGFGTIEPGTPKREEQISFTSITQESNGQALLGGVTRGLAFNPGVNGCTGSSTLSVSHAGSVNFVLSNTACFYQQFAILSNTNAFTSTNTFTYAPTILTPSTNASSAVTYGQLASTSFSGTVNGSTSTKGIYQEATSAQIASGTNAGSTGADLIEPNRYASLIASTSIVSVQASGTLDPSFLSNGNYSLGSTTVQSLTSASTTLNGTTTINGTVSGSLYFTNGSSTAGLGTIAYTGATSSITIPTYVNTMIVNALGGGASSSGGGSATGTLAVTGGTTYYYGVGQGGEGQCGAGGAFGGGGGANNGNCGNGMTWLGMASSFSTSSVVIVGGGGGGTGLSGSTGNGWGGGTTGGTGVTNSGSAGGTGGTQSAGGTGGTAGSVGQGGSANNGNGGGGGGYYGGGSGSGTQNSNGGGGSSYLLSTMTATSTASTTNTTNGSLSIYYSGFTLSNVGVIQFGSSSYNYPVTITFTKAFTKQPSCTVVPSTNTQVWVSAESTSSFTFNIATTTSNMFVNYQCF